jgi:membrane-associated phospholipid phosphatase
MPSWLQELFFGPQPIVFVQQTLGLGWPFPFRVISLLGISWGVILALGLAMWLWGRKAAYSLAGIIVLEALVSLVLNRVFAVERPDAASIVKYEHVELGSFPSGHLFTATIVWGWLYASGRVPFAVPAAVVLGVAIVARMYLGVHFLGDVVGAAIFGAALVWLYVRLWPRAQGWHASARVLRGAGGGIRGGGAGRRPRGLSLQTVHRECGRRDGLRARGALGGSPMDRVRPTSAGGVRARQGRAAGHRGHPATPHPRLERG